MMNDLATVYTAEISRRIRSRPFIIGLFVGVIGIVLLARLPGMLNTSFDGAKSVVLLGDPSVTKSAQTHLSSSFTIVGTIEQQPITAELLKRERAGAALLVTRTGEGLRVHVYTSDPGAISQRRIEEALVPLAVQYATHRSAVDVKRLTTIPITVSPLGAHFNSAQQADAVRGVAYTLLFFLYVLIIVNSQLVLTSVAEEKTSRIAELLVASVNPSVLLSGKILASATLGCVQLVAWIATATLLGGGGSSTDSGDATGLFSLASALDVITPGLVVAFLVFFVIGLLQLSTLFAAGASLVNRTEDLGGLALPLILPIIAAFVVALAALDAPDTLLVVVMSYVPLLSPFVMFARIAVSNVPLWQVGLSLVINVVALYAIAIFAGKVYRVGMLLYGRAPSLAQMWSVLRS
jgi:ABC-2 type transport system permease protein